MLVVFGAAFAIAYASFKYTVLPMFEGLLEAKSTRLAHLAAEELDAPLGADDKTLIAETAASIMNDPDFESVIVRDGHDHVVWMNGAPADGPP